MFSYSTGYYVSPPIDQYLKFKNRCSLLGIFYQAKTSRRSRGNVSFQKSIHVPLIAAIFYHAALFVNINGIWDKIFNENSEVSGKTFLICICRLHVDRSGTRLIFAMDLKNHFDQGYIAP